VSVPARDRLRVASGDGRRCSAKRDEPLSGCGVQQTRDLRAEETVEVGRNHEGGTGFDGWNPSDRWGLRLPGVDARKVRRREGTFDESHERRDRREPDSARVRAL
jgi:hypothetical protein